MWDIWKLTFTMFYHTTSGNLVVKFMIVSEILLPTADFSIGTWEGQVKLISSLKQKGSNGFSVHAAC